MTLYSGLDEMRSWIARGDWDGLEAEFLDRCRTVDAGAATRIGSAPMSRFETEIASALTKVEATADQRTKAVYWEFDPDNSLSSAFFLCNTYRPEMDHDDDRAADFDEWRVIAGPSATVLAETYESSWDVDDRAVAVNLALMGRTIASFGRSSWAWGSTRPLCAGYHDQDVVFRIRPTTESRDIAER